MTPATNLRFRPARRAAASLAALAALAAITVPAANARAAVAAPNDTSLAFFEGGRVDPYEFTLAWQDLVPSNRPAGPTRLDQKRAFLHRIADRKLLAMEATRTPLVLSAEEQAQIDHTRRQLVQNALFTQLTADLPEPTPEDLDRFRRQKRQLAEMRFIVFPTRAAAESWRRRILTGTPMSALDELIAGGGTDAPTAEDYRWVAAEQIPDTLAQVIWKMRPGQVSEVHTFGGEPVLIHLRNYQPRPDASTQSGELGIEAEYRTRQFDRVRQRIRMDVAERAHREFVDEGMDVLLAGYLKVPARSGMDSLTGTPVMRPNLPLPVFTAADTGLIIARTRHGELSIVSYLRYWQRLPGYARPEVRERSVLEATVDRVALEPELVELALARGLDKDPAVEHELAEMREGFALDHYFEAKIQSQVHATEPALRAYFKERPGHYDDPELLEGRMMLLDRRALAESLLTLVRGGRSFGELAKQFSLDAKSAADDGKTGLIARGTNTNVGLEDAMFRTKVGGLGGPERTPEGWVIFRVDRHDPGKKRTFEEAREWVERDFRIVESDRILDAELAELRKKAKLQVFEDRVTEELGSGGPWGD